MTDKWKYKTVTLRSETYSMLNDLREKLVPGFKLSNSGAVDQLIKRETKCNSLGDNNLKEYHGKKKEEAIKV